MRRGKVEEKNIKKQDEGNEEKDNQKRKLK
jgi:hypothetical protein